LEIPPNPCLFIHSIHPSYSTCPAYSGVKSKKENKNKNKNKKRKGRKMEK
jgi:hypothetical protein